MKKILPMLILLFCVETEDLIWCSTRTETIPLGLQDQIREINFKQVQTCMENDVCFTSYDDFEFKWIKKK